MSEITSRCPFCNSDDLRVKPVWKTWHFVACNNCKAGGPVRKTELDAIHAWGERESEKRWKSFNDGLIQLLVNTYSGVLMHARTGTTVGVQFVKAFKARLGNLGIEVKDE